MSVRIKWIIVVAITTLLLSLFFILSPYKFNEQYKQKVIEYSIEINAPKDSVFKYLGNSNNASNWSVFVNHISTLNANEVKDGSVGSIRRCFCNKDESGMKWDELITVVEQGKKRQLIIYNLQNFTFSAEGLATEQLYESIEHNKTKLTFVCFYLNHESTLLEEIKTYIAAYKMKHIFKKNMENIKRIVEERQR